MTTPDPQNGRKQSESQQLGLWKSVQLAWELGFLIAIPAVILGFSGAYLDKYLGSSPAFLLAGFALAAVLSGIGVLRKVKEIFKDS